MDSRGLMSLLSQVNLQQKLVEVRGDDREAVFEMLAEDKKGQSVTVPVSSIPLEWNMSTSMAHVHTCKCMAI